MPLHHKKQSDGTWKTYTSEELADEQRASNEVGAALLVLFGPSALFHWAFCPYDAFKSHERFVIMGVCPVFAGSMLLTLVAISGLVVWRMNLKEKRNRAKETSVDELALRRQPVNVQGILEARKAELERKVQEAEERRAMEELKARADALSKEGREEEAARLLEELAAQKIEQSKRVLARMAEEKKQREDAELARMKAELELLKTGVVPEATVNPIRGVHLTAPTEQPSRRNRVAEMLIRAKLIEDATARLAADHANSSGLRFTAALIHLGLAEEDAIVDKLCAGTGTKRANLWTWQTGESELGLIDVRTCEARGVFPMALKNRVLTLAMTNPTDVITIDELVRETRVSRIQVMTAGEGELQAAISRHYRGVVAKGSPY